MGKLGDFFPDQQKINYVKTRLKPGLIIKLYCSFFNPPKDKYFIIGYIDGKSVPLLIQINSKIRDYILKRKTLLGYQIEIKHSDYSSTLTQNSYIDCSVVKKYFSKSQIEHQLSQDIDRICEDIKAGMKKNIIDVITKTKTISSVDKKLILNALQ